jgi:hypothetical protein
MHPALPVFAPKDFNLLRANFSQAQIAFAVGIDIHYSPLLADSPISPA